MDINTELECMRGKSVGSYLGSECEQELDVATKSWSQ